MKSLTLIFKTGFIASPTIYLNRIRTGVVLNVGELRDVTRLDHPSRFHHSLMRSLYLSDFQVH